MINKIVFPFLCVLAYATPLQAQHESIGTIEATLDGMPSTFHVLSVEGDAAASGAGAIWMPWEEGEGMAAIGGFESRDIKFGKDPETGVPVAEGEGSQISITFQFPLDAERMEYILPAMGAEGANVILMTEVGDYTSMQAMEEGTVSVSLIDANTSGVSRFEGSFQGALVNREGETVSTITDGRFSVQEAVYFNPEE